MKRFLIAAAALQLAALPAFAQTYPAAKPSDGPIAAATSTTPTKPSDGPIAATTSTTPTKPSDGPIAATTNAIPGKIEPGSGAHQAASPTTTPGVAAPTMTPAITAPAAAVTTGLPGANSFTAAQARARLESDGYTNVTELSKDKDGIWRGTASKGSVQARIGVDFKGNIVTQ